VTLLLKPLTLLLCLIHVLWPLTAAAADASAEQSLPATIHVGSPGLLELQPVHARYHLELAPLSAQQVFDLAAGEWAAPEKATINIGPQKHAAWFRFHIKNELNTDVDRLLELRWPHLRDIDFYQRRASGEVIHLKVGLSVNGFEHYMNNTSYLFPLPLAAGESSDVLIRVHGNSYLFLPLFIWDRDLFIADHGNQLMWYCLAFGALLAMMLYNASLYVFTRDRSYYFYSLYALSILIYEISATGIGNRYLWGWSEWARLNVFVLSINMSFLCGSLFARYFLGLEQYGGWCKWLNSITVAFWAGSGLLVLLGVTEVYGLAESMSLFTCFAALITSMYLWKKGNVSARYFTIAWTALIVFTMGTVMMLNGSMPYNAFTQYGQIIGFVLEMLLLSFALAERINRERKQREEAQQVALQLQTEISDEREDRVQAQQQLLELQKQTNKELECRVSERTDELEKAMSELEAANSELEKLSVTDPLTTLSNRRYFDEVLERELQRSQRTQKPLALVMVDLDHFKQINDNYGHLAGDDCLRLVAATLKKLVTRGTDLIARYGGEEFVVILADTTEDDAYRVAERIRSEIIKIHLIYGGSRIPMSASLGVAGVAMGRVMTPGQLIGAADDALYQAKNSGRNRSVVAKTNVS